MSNHVVPLEPKSVVNFSQEQIAVLRDQIAKDATPTELQSFIWQCQRTGLDPFTRQIYFMKSNGRVQIQTSIDGFRLIAERSGAYEGQTPAQWCGSDGVWKDIWLSKEFPVAARVGVWKKGFREPLYAVAHWNEYFAQPGYMHKKMPALMIAKVAESLALRKAFPNEMSGLYTQEEMGKADPVEEHKKQLAAEGNAEWKEDVIKFGSLKGWTYDRAVQSKGIDESEHIVSLVKARIDENKPYANSNIDEMEHFCVSMKAAIDREYARLSEDDVP